MKNLVALARPSQISDYCADLWRSEPFKHSYAHKGFIWQQVERFAYLPRIFAEVSNDRLERSHFSTWWNVIMRREYDNPVVNDLYYLHEMTHAATMPYVPGIGRTAFDEKMQRNELEASVLSEIAIYFEMPGLRKKSFEHEIYADRFVQDIGLRRLWQSNRDVCLETLRSMRRDVMISKPDHMLDKTELWIRRFNNQNAIYFGIWADRYTDVEWAMNELQADVGGDGFREDALEGFLEWLNAEAAKDPFDNIPFRLEAELFAPVYWANKAKYEEAMKETV